MAFAGNAWTLGPLLAIHILQTRVERMTFEKFLDEALQVIRRHRRDQETEIDFSNSTKASETGVHPHTPLLSALKAVKKRALALPHHFIGRESGVKQF